MNFAPNRGVISGSVIEFACRLGLAEWDKVVSPLTGPDIFTPYKSDGRIRSDLCCMEHPIGNFVMLASANKSF